LHETLLAWRDATTLVVDGPSSQSRAYYAIEFAAIFLGVWSSLAMLRRYPGIALFSFAALLMGSVSGAPEGQIRYALGWPALFLFLATAGRNPVFDRSWSILSLLMLGLLASLFAADMWVG
jgi:hypothetical protein